MAEEATERALREAEARYRALVEQIPAIVYTADFGEHGAWSFVSPQIEALLGYSAKEWMSNPQLWFERLHPEDQPHAMEDERRSRETGSLSSEYRMVAQDGRVVWFRDEATIVRDGGRELFMQGVMYDITDRKRAEEDLAFLAYHDKLTGLPNRQMFEELLDLAVARARRHELAVAVLYMDLDGFKLVNDTLGHAAGDKLLQQVAMRLREAIRDSDLVARQGGDEFLLLVGDLERGGSTPLTPPPTAVAEGVASRVVDCLQHPFLIGGTEVYVTASIGISVFPDGSDTPDRLLRQADAAMYESKKLGPGRFLSHSGNEAASAAALSFTTRLRRAVEATQWILHYQPVIDLATGRMASVEALIRWRDPTHGLIPPGDFIPLAEELGLIGAIGDWVIGELAEQWRAWADDGLVVPVSFNLSPRQLRQRDLVPKLVQTLQDHRVDPSAVVIEITESAAMVDPERTQRVFNELHEFGVGLAIDDFGTGYSSLSRLKLLPVDVLKIDRTFVSGVPVDRDSAAMVSAIVQLAHSLGIVPLAEGIETQEQLAFVRQCGCTLAQGFYWSMAIPADDVAAFAAGAHSRPALRVVASRFAR